MERWRLQWAKISIAPLRSSLDEKKKKKEKKRKKEKEEKEKEKEKGKEKMFSILVMAKILCVYMYIETSILYLSSLFTLTHMQFIMEINYTSK